MNTTRQEAPSAEEVVDSVLAASRAFVAIAARSLAGAGEEVTLTQFRTLTVLSMNGPVSLTRLAEEVGVMPATATRMCDRLIAKGLVVRRVSRSDRRQVALGLTERGRSLVEAAMAARRREIARVVAQIPAGERSVLIHALGRFTQATGGGFEPASFGE